MFIFITLMSIGTVVAITLAALADQREFYGVNGENLGSIYVGAIYRGTKNVDGTITYESDR